MLRVFFLDNEHSNNRLLVCVKVCMIKEGDPRWFDSFSAVRNQKSAKNSGGFWEM